MARAVAEKQNGAWVVLVDVDQYGGDEMTPSQARAFAADIRRAAAEADAGRTDDEA